MHPVLFEIGDFTLSTYEAAMSVAFLCAIFLAYRRAAKEGIDQGLVLDLSLWIVIASLFGGRILFILTRLDQYMRDPIEILKFWRGGMVFYGGLIGGVMAVWILLARRKQPFFPVADLLAPYLILGYAIHRSLGCFMAGCCYGAPTKMPWGVVFPPGSPAAVTYGVGTPVHPTQLYTALSGLVIFGILLWLRRRRPFPGALAIALFLLYGLSRFTIEFFRGDAIRGFIGPLSTSQVISLGLIAVAIAWFFVARRSSQVRS
jgi:phosphatidylglycerol:prolipoprotein diacylglycerol transferase